MSYYQGNEPSNKFVEFVVVKGPGILSLFPEAIILYESSTREFTVQVGYKVLETRFNNDRQLAIMTTTGATVIINRKKRGNEENRYQVIDGNGHVLEATRKYLPN